MPDVSLLLYAEVDAYPLHAPARRWWEDLLNGDRPVGLAPAADGDFGRFEGLRWVNPLSG